MAANQDVFLSIGRIASLACLLEVIATKPGNVHRNADFEGLSFTDLAVSAELLGQAIDSRKTDDLGRLVLDAVKARRTMVDSNSNLGIILLICPLAIVANDGKLDSASIRRLLKSTTSQDATAIYRAIAMAGAGGLGESSEWDVAEGPVPESIIDAMQASSDRDMIARQYSNNFQQVFEEVVPLLRMGQQHFDSIGEAIIYAHVSMIARYGDSLIARKCGQPMSDHAKMLARQSLEHLVMDDRPSYFKANRDLDFWLRSDHNKRNPGTTADLVTAGLFVSIINGQISPPFK